MVKSKSPHELSDRGQNIASTSEISAAFEILHNLWDPDTNSDGYVSLGIAENDALHSKMAAYIQKNFSLPHELLTYYDGGAGSRKLTAAIAHFLNRHLKPFRQIDQKQVVVTNGCSSAIECLSYNLANPGDGILLGRPYYRAFLPDMETRPAGKIVPVAFDNVDPFSLAAVDKYELAIRDAKERNHRIAALMLCHPHNPLGRCYPREVLIALMKLCQIHRIHLISDEIYALSIWENTVDSFPPATPFVSILSIDTTGIIDPHLVHCIWGMSKDFGANGLRIGSVISQSNPSLLTAMATLSLYTYPSTLADCITATILSDDTFTDSYIHSNRATLSTRYTLAARFLQSHRIPYLPGANAAFFIVADLASAYRAHHPSSSTVTDKDLLALLNERLMQKRVFIVDSDAIGSEKAGWFRIVFSQKEDYLREGLRRIAAAIEDENDGGDGLDDPARAEELGQEMASTEIDKTVDDNMNRNTSGNDTHRTVHEITNNQYQLPDRPRLSDGQEAPHSVLT